jgi:hypothetical protein
VSEHWRCKRRKENKCGRMLAGRWKRKNDKEEKMDEEKERKDK